MKRTPEAAALLDEFQGLYRRLAAEQSEDLRAELLIWVFLSYDQADRAHVAAEVVTIADTVADRAAAQGLFPRQVPRPQ